MHAIEPRADGGITAGVPAIVRSFINDMTEHPVRMMTPEISSLSRINIQAVLEQPNDGLINSALNHCLQISKVLLSTEMPF